MKRKKKWPYFLIIPLIFAFVFVMTDHRKKKEEALPPPYISTTWEQFKGIKRLKMLLQGFAVQSIADVPCKSFDSFHPHSLNIERYLGVAIERDQADALQAQFGSELCSFMAFDVAVDTLPKVDLILCWDELCALSFQEASAALLQFKKSGAKFLLMRHYPEVKENVEKQKGQFHPINWKLPPYSFPEPIIHIMEEGNHGMEILALWNLEKL